jgi:hypothetical protein
MNTQTGLEWHDVGFQAEKYKDDIKRIEAALTPVPMSLPDVSMPSVVVRPWLKPGTFVYVSKGIR